MIFRETSLSLGRCTTTTSEIQAGLTYLKDFTDSGEVLAIAPAIAGALDECLTSGHTSDLSKSNFNEDSTHGARKEISTAVWPGSS